MKSSQRHSVCLTYEVSLLRELLGICLQGSSVPGKVHVHDFSMLCLNVVQVVCHIFAGLKLKGISLTAKSHQRLSGLLLPRSQAAGLSDWYGLLSDKSKLGYLTICRVTWLLNPTISAESPHKWTCVYLIAALLSAFPVLLIYQRYDIPFF